MSITTVGRQPRDADLPTGWNQWQVVCEKVIGGKRATNILQTVFVKAVDCETAEKIGRSVTGLRYATAFPYRPWRDLKFHGYVTKTPVEEARS